MRMGLACNSRGRSSKRVGREESCWRATALKLALVVGIGRISADRAQCARARGAWSSPRGLTNVAASIVSTTCAATVRRDTACMPADMPCHANATATQACAQSPTPRQARCIASQRAKSCAAERVCCLVSKRRLCLNVMPPCKCIVRGLPHICDASASCDAPHTLGAKVRCSGDIVRTLATYCSLIFAA